MNGAIGDVVDDKGRDRRCRICRSRTRGVEGVQRAGRVYRGPEPEPGAKVLYNVSGE